MFLYQSNISPSSHVWPFNLSLTSLFCLLAPWTHHSLYPQQKVGERHRDRWTTEEEGWTERKKVEERGRLGEVREQNAVRGRLGRWRARFLFLHNLIREMAAVRNSLTDRLRASSLSPPPPLILVFLLREGKWIHTHKVHTHVSSAS